METICLPGFSNPVPVDSIVWLEGDGNYTRVHYNDGTSVLVTQPLVWFEHYLDFIRIHRSSIVNQAYVQVFERIDSRSATIKLLNNKELPVSRNRIKQTSAMLSTISSSNLTWL